MKESLLLYNLKINCLFFSTGLNSSLIIFIRTYTVNYRNALDRLRVRMNIILFILFSVAHSCDLPTLSDECNHMTSRESSRPIPVHVQYICSLQNNVRMNSITSAVYYCLVDRDSIYSFHGVITLFLTMHCKLLISALNLNT